MRIETPSGAIYAEEHGSGHPLLFISGLGDRLNFWSEQTGVFSEHFRVVLHDHLGTGKSDRPIIDYSVQQMAENILSLMDALDIPSAHMVGHSTGGAVIQHIAHVDPSRLDKIVLSATWAGAHAYISTVFSLRKQILEALGPEVYLTDGALRAHPPSYVARNTEAFVGGMKERLNGFAGLEIEKRRLDAVMAYDLRDEVKNIDKETLIICAADDQITPFSLSEEIADLLPSATLEQLPTGGHFCPRVMAEHYNQKLFQFLSAD